MERSADRLWVSYGCPAVWGGGVLSLDMSETTPQPVPLPISQTSGASVIAAAANTLLVAENTRLQVYDLQNGTPALRGVIDTDDLEVAHGWEDLAITADGTKVYATPGSINDFEAWDLTTLSLIRSYGREEGIYNYRAIAVSSDGTRVAASHGFGGETEPVALFDTATGAKIETFAASLHDVLLGSFTFSGTDLFAVTEAWSDVRHSYLWRMHGALLPPCKLTLTGPAETRKYSTTTFTGRLTEPDGSDPAVRQLTVSFREMGQVTTLPGVTTNADGTFTFTHAPYSSGNLTYIVYRENTPDTRSCTASTRVYVQSW
ncbi:YncE family protein [Nonomuraea wenchangensis]